MAKHRYTREEIAEWREKNRSFLYCNTDDSNFVVPKQFGIGWTFNWAHPLAWLVGAAIMALIVYSIVK